MGVDIKGPVQYIQTRSDKHYPGSVITRTYALVDEHVLVVDRIESDKNRTVDWLLKTPGTQLSVPLNIRPGSFTKKSDNPRRGATFGAKIPAHGYAKCGSDFRDHGRKMLMLGYRFTEIFTAPVHYKQTMLMVRRKPHPRDKSTRIDYEVLFSANAKTMVRVPVKRVDGKPANAKGLKITLADGKTFHAIVNWESKGTEVVLGTLKTKERFATDWKRK